MKRVLINSFVILIISAAFHSGTPAEQGYGDGTDVIALVRFLILSQDSPEEYRRFLDKRIEFFKTVPGLKRKYYTYGNTPGLSAGVYHWDSRTEAMEYYDEAWHTDMKQRTESYSLEILDIEVVQDIETGKVTRF